MVAGTGRGRFAGKALSRAGLIVLAGAAIWYLLGLAGAVSHGPLFSSPTFTASEPVPVAQYDTPRMLRYGFVLENPGQDVLRDVEFKVRIPVQLTGRQHCCTDIDTDSPYQLERDQEGHQFAIFSIPHMAPFGRRQIQFTVHFLMAEQPNRERLEDVETDLAAEALVQVNAPEIQQLSQRLQGSSTQETARRIHDWVASRIEYSGYHRDDLGALYAIQNRQGDCTEYMYLFTALARAAGIPTRNVAGYVYERDRRLRGGKARNHSGSGDRTAGFRSDSAYQ